MNTSLPLLLALSGLAGSGHCVLMCGPASAAVAPLAGSDGSMRALTLLQIGRIAGYALLGAIAAAIGTALFDAMSLTQAVRPLWIFSNLFALTIGASLLLLARQPGWLDRIGERVGALTAGGLRFAGAGGGAGAGLDIGAGMGAAGRAGSGEHVLRFHPRGGSPVPRVVRLPALRLLAGGMAWAVVPCGLLYSALVLVMISAKPMDGALAMAAFAAASAVPLLIAQWLYARAAEARSRMPSSGERTWALRSQTIGTRALGLLMLVASGYAVYSVALGDAGRLLCHS